MKTTKAILILCIALCLTTSCKKEADMTLVQKTVLENVDIWRVNVNHGWEATVVYDSQKSFVELEYSAYLEDYVSVGESDEWLSIGFTSKINALSGSVYKATVHISRQDALCLRADNASVITLEGPFELEETMDIELHNGSVCNGFAVSSHSCSIHLDYDSQLLGVNYNGGHCSVYAYKRSSCKGYFNVEQNFTAEVGINSQLIVFGGAMPSASIELKESGTINMVKAEVNDMYVYLDGASEATVNVSETLSGFLLEGSTLYYKGHPQIDVDCSDDSQLIPF